MRQQDPIDRLGQRAFRHSLEDGVGDIVLGVYLLTVGVATQRPALLGLSAAYLLVYGMAWRLLSQRVSGPRIGYAELPGDPPRAILAGALGSAALTMALVAALTLASGRLWDLASWPPWTPVVAGLILAGGFLYMAVRSGVIRYHAYAAITVAGAAFFWLFPFGPRINPSDRLTLLFFALAPLVAGAGVVVLVRFVRHHPVAAMETGNGR